MKGWRLELRAASVNAFVAPVGDRSTVGRCLQISALSHSPAAPWEGESEGDRSAWPVMIACFSLVAAVPVPCPVGGLGTARAPA